MKIRSISFLNVLAGTIVLVVSVSATTCYAQSAVLSEIYGRGVHAFNAGQYDRASEWLNMAIDNGFRDPRAYYFLGLSASASGRETDAEGDFQRGAEIEATGAFGSSVGQALARVQGPTRLKLEQIREKARLNALAQGNARSNARYGELGVSPGGMAPLNDMAPKPNNAAATAKPAPAPRGRAVMAPAVPTGDDPFADDMDQDPVIESNDVLSGVADNVVPAEGSAPAPAAPAAEGNPFEAGGGDPFNPGGGGAADPFGGAGADPFSTGGGNDPFAP